MSELVIIDRDGAEQRASFAPGANLMETIRNAGGDDLFAICGGCRSCGTCHVYLEPAAFNLTGEISDEEEDLLDSSEFRHANSRLSCQIRLADEYAGMRVTIAPIDS